MEKNYSHEELEESIDKIVASLKEKAKNRGDLPYATVEKQIAIINDLASFPLGQFFLKRQGADGYWTDYIINYPNSNNSREKLSAMEEFILYKSPLTIATRERFHIFQKHIQKLLKTHMELCSIPCGLMRDLLSLDYSKISDYKITGIDLDENSLNLSYKLAQKYNLENYVKLIKKNALDLNFNEKFDVITSNGLNVYISEQDVLDKLYEAFYKSLKPGGSLIMGVLTRSPYDNKESDWLIHDLPHEDIVMEQVLFQDILETKWRNFKKIEEVQKDLQRIGFSHIEIDYDKHHIFPTFISTK